MYLYRNSFPVCSEMALADMVTQSGTKSNPLKWKSGEHGSHRQLPATSLSENTTQIEHKAIKLKQELICLLKTSVPFNSSVQQPFLLLRYQGGRRQQNRKPPSHFFSSGTPHFQAELDCRQISNPPSIRKGGKENVMSISKTPEQSVFTSLFYLLWDLRVLRAALHPNKIRCLTSQRRFKGKTGFCC